MQKGYILLKVTSLQTMWKENLESRWEPKNMRTQEQSSMGLSAYRGQLLLIFKHYFLCFLSHLSLYFVPFYYPLFVGFLLPVLPTLNNPFTQSFFRYHLPTPSLLQACLFPQSLYRPFILSGLSSLPLNARLVHLWSALSCPSLHWWLCLGSLWWRRRRGRLASEQTQRTRPTPSCLLPRCRWWKRNAERMEERRRQQGTKGKIRKEGRNQYINLCIYHCV